VGFRLCLGVIAEAESLKKKIKKGDRRQQHPTHSATQPLMDSTSIHEISSPDPARERVISLAEVDEAQTSVPPPRKVVDIQDQSTRPKKILFVTVALCFSIFLSSFEQVAVSTTVPGIARDFGTSTAISWVGTSFLVATYDFLQVGSDI